MTAGSLDREPLDRRVDEFASTHHCPTVSWGVVRDGRLAATGAVGDVTSHTVYRIASMTKSFSAAATLLLRDEGALRLDDPIADHAPELAGLRHAVGDAPPITLRDLLTMASGLPTDDPWADRHLDLTDDEFDEIVADGPMFAAATGTAFEYSNFGFAVLGRVVHRATGRRIQEIVTERLLAPLGMDRTTWVQPHHDDWAPPRRWLDDRFVDELPPLADGLIAPMGGIWSTVHDLATWVGWLDDAFPPRSDGDEGPLRRSSRREMQQPHRYIGQRRIRGITSPAHYGFGVVTLDEAALGTVAMHAGGLPGYGSNMRWLPGRRTGVIALANVTYAPMTELCAELLDLVAAQQVVPPDPSPDASLLDRIAADLVALLNDWDDAATVALFTRSLVQDDALDRRRRDAARVVDDVGALTIESVVADTAARGTAHCRSASGRQVRVGLRLAPPSPARIQSYTVTVDPPAD